MPVCVVMPVFLHPLLRAFPGTLVCAFPSSPGFLVGLSLSVSALFLGAWQSKDNMQQSVLLHHRWRRPGRSPHICRSVGSPWASLPLVCAPCFSGSSVCETCPTDCNCWVQCWVHFKFEWMGNLARTCIRPISNHTESGEDTVPRPAPGPPQTILKDCRQEQCWNTEGTWGLR